MPTKKKEKVVEKNNFYCDACKTDALDIKGLKAHLKERHNVTDMNGTRKMIMHVDGSDWYGYKWEWNIGGVKIMNDVVCKRDAESQMYWGD